MSSRNQTTVSQGNTVTLDVTFRYYAGGAVTDPSPAPIYKIYDPSNNLMVTGTGTRTSTGHYEAQYAVASDATISPVWWIEWIAYINSTLVADAWEYFIVVAAGSSGFGDIVISDDWLQQIKKVVAYPDVPEILLSDDQIKSLIVRQAMHDYFVKFPLPSWVESSVINELIYDFPDANTIGVLHCSIVGKGYAGSPGGSFWDIVMWNQVGFHSNFRNMYGSNIRGYNPNGLRQLRFLDSLTNNTLINQGTFKYRVDQHNRKLYVYSSISAKVAIVWGSQSNDFNDVLYQFQFDVIKLSQGYLLLHLADTAGIVDDTVLEAKIDATKLQERGKDLIKEVTDKWVDYPSPVAFIH